MSEVVEWRNFRLKLNSMNDSQENGGRLPKFWVQDEITGRQFLVKSSTPLSYEPLCEKMAYIIGRDLGLDVLEYDIIESKLFKDLVYINPLCKYVSICERIDRKNYFITSVAEIKRARNIFLDKKITNKEVMYELLPKEYIDKMILFDTIIGNVDRHYGNIHLLRGLDGTIKPAPILDNGASLLSEASIFELFLYNRYTYRFINRSSMIKRNHDEEIKLIDSISNIKYNIPVKTIQILDDIEPILKLLSNVRANSIRQYITYRLHKYIGYT